MTTANESQGKYVDYVNPTPYTWTRPEGPPRVWRVVEGRKKTVDGEILKFSIQEVPKELENDVVDFMEKYFTVEEPICVDLGTANNVPALREFRTLWRNILRQGVSVVALTVNSNPSAKPAIAGVNVLTVLTVEDKSDVKNGLQLQTGENKKLMEVITRLSKEADSLKKYGVDKYLSGLGLSVDPFFRGQGIGQELIRAREDIGLAYQIPMSETVFTAPASQILAARAGYEVLVEKNYSDLLDDEGKVAFPSVTVKSIKLMGRRLY